MKRRVLIFLVVTIIFLLLTKLTSINESSFDGDDLVGFPLKFFTYRGGKLMDKNTSRIVINYTNLVIDILIYISTLLISLKILGSKAVKK